MAAVATLMLVSIGACGDDSPEAPSPSALPSAPSGPAGMTDCVEGEPCEVSRELFGDEWPFTLERGVIRCETVADAPEGSLLDSTLGLLFDADGTTYAINFPALRVAEENGWRDGEEISAGDPTSLDFGPSTAFLLSFAALLCEGTTPPGGETGTPPSFTEPSVVTAPGGPGTIGSPITLADQDGEMLEVTVLDVVDPSPPDEVFPADGRYVSIQLRVRYLGTQEEYAGPLGSGWILLDEAGQQFVSSAFGGFVGQSIGRCCLVPGEEQVGFVTFDLPPGSLPTRLQLTLDAGFGPEMGEWAL